MIICHQLLLPSEVNLNNNLLVAAINSYYSKTEAATGDKLLNVIN